MATKKEIKKILIELGLTAADMDGFWEDAKTYNPLVAALFRAGKNWTDMNDHCIRSLPTLKEKHLENLKRLELEAEKIKKEKELAEQKQKSLDEVGTLLARIQAKDLSPREIRDIVFGDSAAEVIEQIRGESGRWVTYMQTVICLAGEYFICNNSLAKT